MKVLELDASHSFAYKPNKKAWYDTSGNDNHAYGDSNSAHNSTEKYTFPEFQTENGGRFYFNGATGLVIPSPLLVEQEQSHEIWFKDTQQGNGRFFLSDARNSRSNLFIDNKRLIHNNSGNSGRGNSGQEISLQNWTHLIVAGDSEEIKIFVDKKGTEPHPSYLSSFSRGIDKNFRIGSRYNSSQRFEGYMGLYRIFDEKLSQEQVEEKYEEHKHRFI